MAAYSEGKGDVRLTPHCDRYKELLLTAGVSGISEETVVEVDSVDVKVSGGTFAKGVLHPLLVDGTVVHGGGPSRVVRAIRGDEME